MGQKTHPIGFRLGVIREPDSRWYANKKQYPTFLKCDWEIRNYVKERLGKGTVSRVDIERSANKVRVTLFTARPGAVIGRGGKGIDEMTRDLDKIVARYEKNARVHVNVNEVRQPELDAQLVADNIALQIERRIAPRRAMRQAITRALKMNCRGMKIIVSGRLGGAEIARSEQEKFGKIPLHTLRADIDYAISEAQTTYGVIGVKVWIYKGEVLPEKGLLGEKPEKPERKITEPIPQETLPVEIPELPPIAEEIEEVLEEEIVEEIEEEQEKGVVH